jgi:hypothetical protein
MTDFVSDSEITFRNISGMLAVLFEQFYLLAKA